MSGLYPGAIWLPGPPSKTGYQDDAGNRILETHAKIGCVIHTMEYESTPEWNDATTLHNALFSGREASWTFSICKFMNGSILYQHYPLDAVTWHAGYQGNLWLIGIETEGIAPGKFTEAQCELLVKLLKWIKEAQGWLPYDIGDRREVLGDWPGGWLYEHNAVPGAPPTNCQVFTHQQVDATRLLNDLKEANMSQFNDALLRKDWHTRRWSSELLRKAAGMLDSAAALCGIAWSEAEYKELAEMIERADLNLQQACKVLAEEGLGPETGNKKIVTKLAIIN